MEPLKGDASECGSMSHQILWGTLSKVVGEATTASGIRGSQARGQKWAPLWASLAMGRVPSSPTWSAVFKGRLKCSSSFLLGALASLSSPLPLPVQAACLPKTVPGSWIQLWL